MLTFLFFYKKSVLNYVCPVSSCPTCLTCLLAFVTLSLICLPYFTCLTYAHLITCLRCLPFLSALRTFTFFYIKGGTTKNQLQKTGISKNECFVFENFDISDFELVFQKQLLWGVLKILNRIPWSKFLKNTFEWIKEV